MLSLERGLGARHQLKWADSRVEGIFREYPRIG